MGYGQLTPPVCRREDAVATRSPDHPGSGLALPHIRVIARPDPGLLDPDFSLFMRGSRPNGFEIRASMRDVSWGVRPRQRGVLMIRLASVAAVLTVIGTVLAGGSMAAEPTEPFPEVIRLPIGFRPEGIEVGRGTTFYVGSVASGAIQRGNLRTGSVEPLVSGGEGRPAA